MNYYSHHIGDYMTDTAHLSILEDGTYRRLMDRYYTTEAPLIADETALFRLIRARSDEDKESARIVLSEFFTLTDAGWTHKRCDAEIAAFREKSEKATASINKRWGKDSGGNTQPATIQKNETTVVIRPTYERNTDVIPTNNQEPLTNNQEPIHPTPSATEPSAAGRGVTSAELSIAMRKSGVSTQPADPRLIALAAQGVTAETVTAACEEAKRSKPGEQITPGYAFGILKRWGAEATAIKISGVSSPPARASPAKPQSRHSGFETLDYSEGIEDGRIL